MTTPAPPPGSASTSASTSPPAPMEKASQQRVSFEQLIRKVRQAEDVVEARERRVVARYRHLTQTWREGWTPIRIIAVGLASGFLVGRAEPLRALTGARMLQMVGAVSGLFASVQATFAAEQAEQAADSAEDVATDQAGVGVAPAQRATPAMRPGETDDGIPPVQPRPAEAATELSYP